MIEYVPVAASSYSEPAEIDLEVSDDELIRISEEGLLALNLEEMHTIQAHYRDPIVQEHRRIMGLPPAAPTDVELECLAQTWSEHCKHKIFAAHIHHIDEETGIGTRFFEYETAWGPLQEDFWLSVSEMFPTLKFTIYYEEHGMCFHGIDSYHESDVVYSMSDDLPQPSEDMSDDEKESFYDGERYYELIEAKTNEWYKQVEKVYQAV